MKVFDKEQMEGPAQPWEFRSKPAWQRLIIMLGGVIVNFILGFFIFAMMLWGYGENYFPAENITEGIEITDSVANELGLQNGDEILKVGDRVFDKFEQGIVVSEIVLNNASTIDILRNNQPLTLKVKDEVVPKLSSYGRGALFIPRALSGVLEVNKGSNADKGGLKVKDKFLSINGMPAIYSDQFTSIMEGKKSEVINAVVDRNGRTMALDIRVDENGKLGFVREQYMHQYKAAKNKYSLFGSIPAGIKKGWKFLGSQIKAFSQMGKGKMNIKDSVGGPIAIANLFGKIWDWERFWGLTASLSLILAFMNLLPIPALDGGHVLFLLWEMITGKKPSDKFLEYATLAGFVILMALMVLIFGNDIRRLIVGMIGLF